MLWKFQKRIKHYLKSPQNSCKLSVKEFISSTVVGLHFASLLKQRDCLDFENTYF